MEDSSGVVLSIIIVNFNGQKLLPKLLASLEVEVSRVDFLTEVLLVDNASEDDSVAFTEKNFPTVKIICLRRNLGFARAANAGAKESRGTFLLFLNNDVEIMPGCLSGLLRFLQQNPAYALVAPAVLNPDHSFQLSFGRDLSLVSEFFLKYLASSWYSFWFRVRKEKLERDVDWASGVAVMVRRECFFRVDGFDERFFLYVEDADLGLRLRKQGYKLRYFPQARVIHFRGAVASRFPRLAIGEAKKGQLLYYQNHRHPFAFRLLRAYLLARFRLKRLGAAIIRNQEKKSLYDEVISLIRGFNRATPA
ncbi:MAG: glycosyltransferase family 2 protein [Candidatus Aminicenantales bacterium]